MTRRKGIIPNIKTTTIDPAEMLARMVTGTFPAELVETDKKRPISVKCEPDLYQELEFFQKASGKSMTQVVQLLLWIGVRDVKKHLELAGQMEMDLKPKKGAKK